jgi:hypothetical protein
VIELLFLWCGALCAGLVVGFVIPRRRLLSVLAGALLGLFWLGISANGEQRAYFALILVGCLLFWIVGVSIGISLRTRWRDRFRQHKSA